MSFDEVLSQTIALLQREKRVSYRGLKRRFGVDDAFLEDLKAEIVKAKKLAVDEDGEVLVWVGEDSVSGRASRPTDAGEQEAPTLPDSRSQTLDTPWREGDRRQLTVMFCDLVGSTALSTHLDPEELQRVVQHYQRICTAVISRYDGYVAQYLGDGLLVYFGYPVAHEDAARRAVRTGLEIIPALQHSTVEARSAPLQVHVGIHTGLVVLGDIGAGARIERLALGETPNIAARIQSLAAPDTVTVSAATHRLIEGYFECQSLGAHELKGVATPMAVYRVLREGQAASHMDVAAARGLTPLVGRAGELELLLARWEEAKAGQAQVALVHGEAGIGKSRLVQTLKEHVTREGYTRWEMRCSPYHQNSALYPVIEGLQRILQFTREESPEQRFHKLEQFLSVEGESALAPGLALSEAVPLFAALLSLPLPECYPVFMLTPQKQKEKPIRRWSPCWWSTPAGNLSWWSGKTSTGPIRPQSNYSARSLNTPPLPRYSQS
jgi:class 3 adenylate cyclase